MVLTGCPKTSVLNYQAKVRGKNIKFDLEQATKARGGVEIQFYSFFNTGTRWGGC